MEFRRRQFAVPIRSTMEVFLRANNIDTDNTTAKESFFGNLLRTDKDTKHLDLNYYSQYQPSLGFRFGIERIHDNKTNGFFACLASIVPFANYYDEHRKGNPKDSFIFFKPDMECNSASVKFHDDEGTVIMKDFELDKSGLSMIVDIKVYLPDKDVF